MSRFLWHNLLIVVGALAALPSLPSPCRATMPPIRGMDMPAEVSAAVRDGACELPARGLGVSAAQSFWRVPVILVSYPEDTLYQHNSLTFSDADFNLALFDSTGATVTGSVYDYYRWVSGNRVTVKGEVVATVQVPYNKFYYAYNCWGTSRTSTPRNLAGFVKDALTLSASQVNWSDYDLDGDGYVDMVWVVHAGIPGEASPVRSDNDLWSMTSKLAGYWSFSTTFTTPDLVPGTENRYIKVNRFTVLPELSAFHPTQISEIGVYCHEFGHALGLPDLYDVLDGGVTDVGPGCWSLMGTGGWGGNSASPEYPTHVGAWPALWLGWTQAILPTEDTQVTLAPISSGLQVLELSFQGEDASDHFLVETRKREGFDRKLPADGLIVYHVNEKVIEGAIPSNLVNSGLNQGLVVVEANGMNDLTEGGNRGDAADPFPGLSGRTFLFDDTPAPNTLTFSGNPSGVGLFDIASVTGGMSFLAQVRATGWLPTEDVTSGVYSPVESQTPARTAAQAADGAVYSVASETRAGRQQIVLRTRSGDTWDEGIEVSNSPGDALEPALTRLGANDLACVWTDTRRTATHLFYRARVGGVWTEETCLDTTAGEHRAPTIGADDHGGIHVGWVYVGQALPEIRYMRFPYLSPFGQPFVLSGADAFPSKPVVAAIPGGGAFVLWVDDAAWPSVIRFARCGPDSVPGSQLMLTPQSGYPQTWVSALVDPDENLHSLWLENNAGTLEIRYQERLARGGYVQQDTLLETSASTISRARLARDPEGCLHYVYERTVNDVSQIRYRRRRPLAGWDAFATDISYVAGGAATQPSVLPTSPENVLVLYRGFSGSVPRMLERVRTTDQPPLVAVPEVIAPASPRRALLLPNPVRAGQPVDVLWTAATAMGGRTSDALEVFDLAGRRVAVVALSADGELLRGRLGAALTRPWQAGVYFVRPRGMSGPAQRLVVLR